MEMCDKNKSADVSSRLSKILLVSQILTLVLVGLIYFEGKSKRTEYERLVVEYKQKAAEYSALIEKHKQDVAAWQKAMDDYSRTASQGSK